MFTIGTKTAENKITSLYEVEDTIQFQLKDIAYSSKAGYNIHLEKNAQFKNQILLNRSGFKIDDKEVEKKFPKISNLYFSSLFPMLLTYHEGNYLIAEYKETVKRIMEHDQHIRSNFTGDGLDYIRDQFLNTVKNQTVFQRFLEQMPIYQVLNISAYPNHKKNPCRFKWNIAGLGVIEGEGIFKFDNAEKKMNFSSESMNEAYFIELLEKYLFENEIIMSLSIEDDIDMSFAMEAFYNDALTSIVAATAELTISVNDKFKYNQNFVLTSSQTNN